MSVSSEHKQRIIDEFRANAGRVGGPFAGATLLLLTTTGAKSGRRTVSPVVATVDGDRVLIYASAAGGPKHPAWYHNLITNPDVAVEFGAATFSARSTVVTGAERDRLWAEQVARVPSFGEYQRTADRVIPIVALERIHRDRTDDVEIRHSLNLADAETVAALRTAVAPIKGTMDGPHARGLFDQTMEQTPAAADVGYEEDVIGGVPGVWCRPPTAFPGAAILYLHGGAYVLGSTRAYRHFVGQIAARTGVVAFAADYRLAPEHVFPAAVDDAKAVYRGLADGGAQAIAIVGDSAGGGLALMLLSAAQSDARAGNGVGPVAAVAMSPWTDLGLTGRSLQNRADDDPLLTKAMLATTGASYLAGHDPRDPLASPLYGDLAGLPPIQLHVGTSEVLLDDARRYAERAHTEGVDATVHVWDGMTHVFPASVGTLDAAAQALDIMTAFLKDKLRSRER